MKKDIKNEIIKKTVELIEERGSNPDNITIREICDRVGIGAGLVNYHFQTKENLISQCVQKIIGGIIGKNDGFYNSLSGMTPIEKLRFMAKSTCSFLAANENISRISILTDMQSAVKNDNTFQTAAVYYPLIRDIYSKDISDEEVKRKTYLFIITLQSAFLQNNLLKNEINFDFQDKQQRDNLVDYVINEFVIPKSSPTL